MLHFLQEMYLFVCLEDILGSLHIASKLSVPPVVKNRPFNLFHLDFYIHKLFFSYVKWHSIYFETSDRIESPKSSIFEFLIRLHADRLHFGNRILFKHHIEPLLNNPQYFFRLLTYLFSSNNFSINNVDFVKILNKTNHINKNNI